MGRSLKQVLAKLPERRRKKIKARTAELIAERNALPKEDGKRGARKAAVDPASR